MPVPIVNLSDIMSKLAKISWLWEGWLPRGFVTLMVGEPGVGKSFVALDIANRVVQGLAWPDQKPSTHMSRVLWIDTEASQALLAQRVRDWQVPADRIIWPSLDPLENISIDKPGDMEVLEEIITETHPDLVVVDSLRGSYRGDQNDPRVFFTVRTLSTLASKHNLALLATGHLRKRTLLDTTEITMERVSGSFAIAYAARVIWALSRPNPATDEVKVSVIKNNLSLSPDPLGFIISEDCLLWREPPKSPEVVRRLDAAKAYLVAYLSDGPVDADSVLAAAAEVDISASTLGRAKRELRVQSTKSGKRWLWSLPTSA